MKRLFAVVLALICAPALAQGTATLTWELPDQYTNGDPLNPETDLAEIRVYANGALLATTEGTDTQFVTDELSPGTYDFTVTAVAVNGIESAMSNSASKVIPDMRVPESPNLLEVIIAFVLDLIRTIGRWFV
jgi:hypothetical protein